MVCVNNEKELNQAVSNDEFEILIENPILGKIVFKFKNLGKAKWLAVAGSLAVVAWCVYLAVPASPAPPVEGLVVSSALTMGGVALGILGFTATIAAIKISYYSKGKIVVLEKIRKEYDLIKNGESYLLRKKALYSKG